MQAGEIDAYSMEERLLQKGGGVVWVEANRAVVRDVDGNLRLLVGSMRDITAQRQAEAEVRALNSELEARVEQRTAELQRSNQNLEASAGCAMNEKVQSHFAVITILYVDPRLKRLSPATNP